MVLDEDDFGAPGPVAVESIGPFNRIRACGALITVHDSIIAVGKGIGHHPHRLNERLFYLERGTFDHDDALNGISGQVPEGALARFTEGRRGMVHQEWNRGDRDAEIYILVASTDPVPAETTFEVLERDPLGAGGRDRPGRSSRGEEVDGGATAGPGAEDPGSGGRGAGPRRPGRLRSRARSGHGRLRGPPATQPVWRAR